MLEMTLINAGLNWVLEVLEWSYAKGQIVDLHLQSKTQLKTGVKSINRD
jgi:hypothetical protein